MSTEVEEVEEVEEVIPPTLKETLKADLDVNFKARNELQIAVLRSVLGEIQTLEKKGKVAVEFDDVKVLEVLAAEAKKRRDSSVEYADHGVPDRAAREAAEAEVIAAYLPAALSDAEVEAIVDAVVAELDEVSPKSFGLVMKNVTAQTKGRADGKVVSDLVRAKLS